MAEHILLLFQYPMKYLKMRGFHFLHCHFLCRMPPIEEFLFHSRPHALASCVVMAASPGAVHTLKNAVFCNCPAIGSLVYCVPRSEWITAPLSAGQAWTALSGVRSHNAAFMLVSIASPRTAASKQSNMADTYSFPSFALISVISVTHFLTALWMKNPVSADRRIFASHDRL